MHQPFAIGSFRLEAQHLGRSLHHFSKRLVLGLDHRYDNSSHWYISDRKRIILGCTRNPHILTSKVHSHCKILGIFHSHQPKLFDKFWLPAFSNPSHYSENLFLISRYYTEKKSEESKVTTDLDDDEKNLSLVQKFKLMYKRYWYVLIPVHCITSIFWYGSFFLAVKSGVDIVPFMENIGVSEKVLSHLRDTNAGYYAVAYAMYKIATPARYTVTVGGTTLSITYLKNRGYIKPVPTKDELKDLYHDKKDELIERTEEMKGKYQERREDIRERYDVKKEEIKEKYVERREEIIERYRDRAEGFREKFFDSKDENLGSKKSTDSNDNLSSENSKKK